MDSNGLINNTMSSVDTKNNYLLKCDMSEDQTTDYSQYESTEDSSVRRGENDNSYLTLTPGINYLDRSDDLDLSPFMARGRRTRWNKTFGPIKPGSLRGSIFTLCAAGIGAGVLSMPYILKQSGFILGILIILIGAVSAYFSMRMVLVRAMQHKCKNYTDLATKAGGKPLMMFLQISILMYIYGACLSYQIVGKFHHNRNNHD